MVDFYYKLYASYEVADSSFQSISNYPSIRESGLSMLSSAIFFEETKQALFSMKKTLRLQGQMASTLSFLNLNGTSLALLSSNLFKTVSSNQVRSSRLIKPFLITLIPKCEDPSKVSHFRPIALCNVIYKVITKIIAQRLLPYVVSENQSSFIPGRSTVDNILDLQETIHSFKNLQGKKGYMILKLDLEKA